MRKYKVLKGSAFVSCFVCVLLGCSPQHKTASATVSSSAPQPACTDQLIGKMPPLAWMKESKAQIPNLEAQVPPSAALFSIDRNNLKRFFAPTEDTRITNIPLPEPVGCQVFELYESGTMPAELKAKYPDLVSLKGRAMNNRAAEIRLDYANGKLNAQVAWGNADFIIKPLDAAGKIFYVIYERKNTLDKKASFEQSGQQIEMKRYDH